MTRGALIFCTLLLVLLLPAKGAVSFARIFSNGAVLQRDKPVLVWGWAKPGEEVSLEWVRDGTRSIRQAKADREGQWSVTLQPLQLGAALTLSIRGKDSSCTISDLLVGDVYQVSGQSNAAMSMGSLLQMVPNAAEEIAATTLPQVRILEVPSGLFRDSPQRDLPVECCWKSVAPNSTPGFSALAFYFATDLHKHLGIPIGIVRASHAGGRAEIKMSKEALLSFENGRKCYESSMAAYEAARSKRQSEAAERHTADGLPPEPQVSGTVNGRYPASDWNGSIYPVIQYTKSGIVWYQGEHNAGAAGTYAETLSVLLQSWRKACGDPLMPFLLVQLPRFDGKGWQEIRQAQLEVHRKTPNCGFVVTIDLGVRDNIHPPDKKPIGERLALEARRLIYGENVSGCGPLFERAEVKDDMVAVFFNNAEGGLNFIDPTGAGFEVADASGVFIPAAASISGSSVRIKSSQVAKPSMVRYLWSSFPERVSLFNKNGFPAAPFQADLPN